MDVKLLLIDACPACIVTAFWFLPIPWTLVGISLHRRILILKEKIKLLNASDKAKV